MIMSLLAAAALLPAQPAPAPPAHQRAAAALDQMAHHTSSRWDALDLTAAGRWSAAPPPSNAPPRRSFAAALSAWQLYDQLLARIANSNDPLEHLDLHAPALELDGAPRTLYTRAYAEFWHRRHARAERLFCFLLLPANTNGFARGNSHFWTAHLLRYHHHDPSNALPHYLAVHRHAACLVFTDAAYCEAARIYATWGKTNTALALFAVQVPSIDYWRKEQWKALCSFHLALASKDYTNAAWQVLRAHATFTNTTTRDVDAGVLQRYLEHYTGAPAYAGITNWLAAFMSPELYETEATRAALLGPDAATNDPALVDMLLHEWPAFEWVAEHHPAVVTNRELSNNIFHPTRRTGILAP